MYRLQTETLGIRFGQLKVFADINLELATGQSTAVVGPNGSGKSTFLLTLLGYHRANRGSVVYSQDDTPLSDDSARLHTALVSPYLNLYDQLTAEENLRFFGTLTESGFTGSDINKTLERVGLAGRGTDQVGTFSSGMKQRLKYALASLRKPDFVMLDEPTANLDEPGKKIVADLINDWKPGCVLLIATNEPNEQELADNVLRLGQ